MPHFPLNFFILFPTIIKNTLLLAVSIRPIAFFFKQLKTNIDYLSKLKRLVFNNLFKNRVR